MVYTITFNPALDYVLKVENLNTGGINRSYEEELYYGGKGINVSAVLTRLGVENKALGFIAGFTGKELEKRLKADGIDCDFALLSGGMTRINVKIKSDVETDINANGPEINKGDIEALMTKLEGIQSGDFLVLAGSVPEALPEDIYEKIMSRLDSRGVKFVVDTTGKLLMNALKFRPFLIKPNHLELGALFGGETESEEDIIKYAKKLQSLGARSVLISRAEKGAILIDENKRISKINAVQGKAVNSVGSGDSMVAGFLAGYIKTADYSLALRLGAACGSATAFSEGLASKEMIDKIYEKLI